MQGWVSTCKTINVVNKHDIISIDTDKDLAIFNNLS
jgi:hypothetical protein